MSFFIVNYEFFIVNYESYSIIIVCRGHISMCYVFEYFFLNSFLASKMRQMLMRSR